MGFCSFTCSMQGTVTASEHSECWAHGVPSTFSFRGDSREMSACRACCLSDVAGQAYAPGTIWPRKGTGQSGGQAERNAIQ